MTPVFPLFPCQNTDKSDNEMYICIYIFSQLFDIFNSKACRCGFRTNLAVEDHYVAGVRGQPGLHGLTDSTDPVQGWGVKIRPAIVLHLNRIGRYAESNLSQT